jgi:hypothetical protein
MKHYQYNVIFLSGDEDTFYAASLMGAFCAATFYMSNKGRDARIKSIEDEFGTTYTNFELIYKTN